MPTPVETCAYAYVLPMEPRLSMHEIRNEGSGEIGLIIWSSCWLQGASLALLVNADL